jgi:hypothetical protein
MRAYQTTKVTLPGALTTKWRLLLRVKSVAGSWSAFGVELQRVDRARIKEWVLYLNGMVRHGSPRVLLAPTKFEGDGCGLRQVSPQPFGSRC